MSLLFASNLGWRELAGGAGWASLATAMVVLFAVKADIRFSIRIRDLLVLWRWPWAALTGTGQVLRSLLMQLSPRISESAYQPFSRILLAPFDPGPQGSPADAGRRALVVIASTSTPNSIILGLSRKRRQIVYHQIDRSPLSAITTKLGGVDAR